MPTRRHREPGKCTNEKKKVKWRRMRLNGLSNLNEMRWQSCKIVRFVSLLVRDSYINIILLLRAGLLLLFFNCRRFATLIFVFFAYKTVAVVDWSDSSVLQLNLFRFDWKSIDSNIIFNWYASSTHMPTHISSISSLEPRHQIVITSNGT